MNGSDKFLTLLECERITYAAHPDWNSAAVCWQARKMFEGQERCARALVAGLKQASELRDRMEHGLGIEWPELYALEPEERTFVLAAIRARLKPRPVRSN